jgi:hypothetical protein
VLSLAHIRHDWRKPEFAQWRAATAIALAQAGSSARIGVEPAYARDVVRYYLPPAQRARADAATEACGTRQRVLLLGGLNLLDAARLTALRDCYPQLIEGLRFVEVRKQQT